MSKDKFEGLVSALTAIKLWDDLYMKSTNPSFIETTAWEARRRRVPEIVEQLEREGWVDILPSDHLASGAG